MQRQVSIERTIFQEWACVDDVDIRLYQEALEGAGQLLVADGINGGAAEREEFVKLPKVGCDGEKVRFEGFWSIEHKPPVYLDPTSETLKANADYEAVNSLSVDSDPALLLEVIKNMEQALPKGQSYKAITEARDKLIFLNAVKANEAVDDISVEVADTLKALRNLDSPQDH
ncbi:hypothetical protein [Neptuniibacter sp. QD37_11]|uniref:hypothetical protein n=1 Tax=Neptuniibacter sp. QD37_11 TaxID=3398209 RepID=UPI0039F63993